VCVELVQADIAQRRPDLLLHPLRVDLAGVVGESRVQLVEPLVEQPPQRRLGADRRHLGDLGAEGGRLVLERPLVASLGHPDRLGIADEALRRGVLHHHPEPVDAGASLLDPTGLVGSRRGATVARFQT